MAEIRPPRAEGAFTGYARFAEGEATARPRRRLARYGVPVAVASVAAATIGIGTALATTGGGPHLPKVTARQLLARVAADRVTHLSGSVRVSTDLGLPSALLDGAGAAALGGSAHGAADPRAELTGLLSGTHTLRVAADGPSRGRVSVVGENGGYTVVRDGRQVWTYDAAQHAATHATLPAEPAGRPAAGAHDPAGTPGQAAARLLAAVGPTTSVTVDGTDEVAGQDAYDLLVRPRQAGSTIGAVHVAVDAANGVPLRLTVEPAGGGAPVLDVAYTRVSFAAPAAGTFRFTVPKGTHVTRAVPGGAGHRAPTAGRGPAALPWPFGPAAPGSAARGASGPARVSGHGWTRVAELSGPRSGTAHGTGAAGPLGALGRPVKGAFGSGTVVSTRVVTVLVERNGAVFAGAVTPATLVRAADAAARTR